MNETTATIAVFGAAQLGALIWFLGGVRTLLQQHERRIEAVEIQARATDLAVAEMKGELRA